MTSEILKITVVGDGGVGKTHFINVFKKRVYQQHYIPTVFDETGADINVDGKVFNLRIWDTGGQEDYNNLRPIIYPNTHVFIICYSIDTEYSHTNVKERWVPEVKKCYKKVPILLVGTKTDLRDLHPEKCFTCIDGKKLCKKIKGGDYAECSAIQNTGIDEVFEKAVKVWLESNKTVKKKPNLFKKMFSKK